MKKVSFFLLIMAFLCLLTVSAATAELAIPQNIRWKEDSTATAIWDPVTGADYYYVKVVVYRNGAIIGEQETGTSINEVDIQAQINSIIADKDCTIVKATFSVAAVIKTNGEQPDTIGGYSECAPLYSYKLKDLTCPVDITFDENGKLSWDVRDGADFYSLIMRFDKQTEEENPPIVSGFSVFDYTVSGSRASADIMENIRLSYAQECSNGTIEKGETVHVSFQVQSQAWIGTEPNQTNTWSDVSEASNAIPFSFTGIEDLAVPTNVVLGEDWNLSWDAVEGADFYTLIMCFDKQSEEENPLIVSGFSVFDYTVSGSRVSADILENIRLSYAQECSNGTIENGEAVYVSFRVQSQAWIGTEPNQTNIWSDISEDSNAVLYSSSDNKDLSIPAKVTLDEYGGISWDAVDGADFYTFMIRFTEQADDENALAFAGFSTFDYIVEGNRAEDNISEEIQHLYVQECTDGRINKGDTVFVSVQIQAQAWIGTEPNQTNIWSEYSEYSNSVCFTGVFPVNSIKLSPIEPILYRGNSMYLGITIFPEYASYDLVEWGSSDPMIASVESNGKITGLSEGTVTITAKVGLISKEVPLTVYTVSSNIEDESSKEKVMDTAGTILDDIANNEKPDISATDLEAEEMGQIRTEIIEAVENAESIRADIVQETLEELDIQTEWEAIQNAVPDAQFAVGADVVIEITHQGDDGRKDHIANITELDSKVTFTLEAGNVPEEALREDAELSLVRIHEGEAEVIPVMANDDGTFAAESNLFSKFVLVYKTKEDTKNNTGWGKTEAGWVYTKEDGTKATDWLEIDGAYYCFDENGVMRTGWYEENGFTYYLGTDGKMATGDVEVDGIVYRFNEGGACTGEATEDPGTQEPATPEARGWVYAATGWVYLKEDGARATGWLNDGDTWYYMNDSGYMLTGWVGVNGTWYYMQPSGAMATGWVNDGGTWYYMKSSGAMATGWLSDGGTWYYMRPSGDMATGWVYDGNAWYYMKPSGTMATGWMLDRGTWYYFKSSGVMMTGWQKIGSTWYYFYESGAMATGWYEEKDAWGNTTAWYWFDDSGAMATGWKEINGQWEMFADSGAWLYTWVGK